MVPMADSFPRSLACNNGSQTNGDNHFVLVRLDLQSQVEAEAILQATEDLNHAFGEDGLAAGAQVATSLKALGYVRETVLISSNKTTRVRLPNKRMQQTRVRDALVAI